MWTKTKKKYIVKKKIVVCGNDIAEIEERYKKKYAYSYSFSIFFHWNSLVCHVLLWQKKVEWNCGNDIAEIGRKKIYSSWFLAMPLPKLRGKKKTCGNEFVAMALPK